LRVKRQQDIEDGWFPAARHSPSPNFDRRPAGVEPSLLVIHGISLPPGEFGGPWIDRLFRNQLPADSHPFFREIRHLRVSSHLLIRRAGELVQYVDLRARAWHAGRSRFRGRRACNDIGIGVELEGCDDTPYTDVQYRILADVAAAIVHQYPAITPDRVVGHCHIAPGRKTDPGPVFHWHRLRTALADRVRPWPPRGESDFS
jgi:AmpD protein